MGPLMRGEVGSEGCNGMLFVGWEGMVAGMLGDEVFDAKGSLGWEGWGWERYWGVGLLMCIGVGVGRELNVGIVWIACDIEE